MGTEYADSARRYVVSNKDRDNYKRYFVKEAARKVLKSGVAYSLFDRCYFNRDGFLFGMGSNIVDILGVSEKTYLKAFKLCVEKGFFIETGKKQFRTAKYNDIKALYPQLEVMMNEDSFDIDAIKKEVPVPVEDLPLAATSKPTLTLVKDTNSMNITKTIEHIVKLGQKVNSEDIAFLLNYYDVDSTEQNMALVLKDALIADVLYDNTIASASVEYMM